jgi:hypothetical protein
MNGEQRKERHKIEPGSKGTSFCRPVQQIHKRCRQGRLIPQLLLSSEENCEVVDEGGVASD